MPRPWLRFNRPSKGWTTYDRDPEDEEILQRHTFRGDADKTSLLSHVKLDLSAMAAEFIGTFIFLWLAFMGAQSAQFNSNDSTKPDNQTVLFIALSFGMSLVVTAWVFFRVSGAAFNPAVTFSLYLVGNLTASRALMTAFAQLLGGIAAAAVTQGLTPSTFAVANKLTDGVGKGNGLVIEMFTTSTLVFSVLMMAAEKHRSTFLAPVAIGLALFIGHLASVGWTGAGINPARTFGPEVVIPQFPNYCWIYYVGQFAGAILATVVYGLLKHIDYQEIVPDVDTLDPEQSQAIGTAPLSNIVHGLPRAASSVKSLSKTKRSGSTPSAHA